MARENRRLEEEYVRLQEWLDSHPDDERTPKLKRRLDRFQEEYIAEYRECVLRAAELEFWLSLTDDETAHPVYEVGTKINDAVNAVKWMVRDPERHAALVKYLWATFFEEMDKLAGNAIRRHERAERKRQRTIMAWFRNDAEQIDTAEMTNGD